MKVVIDQKVLAQSLGRLLGMVPKKKGYESMLLIVRDGTEHLEAYLGNGAVYAQERIPCSILEEGSCVVQSESFSNLIKNLTVGEPTHLTLEGNVLMVRQNRLRYSMRMHAFDSFWRLATPADAVFVPINPDELVGCVSSVSYAVLSEDPFNPKSHVLVESLPEGQIRAVAVDNIRFASKQGVGVLPESLLLSQTDISGLKKLISGREELVIAVSSGVAHFHTPQGFLKVRTLAAPFPPFKQIFPQKSFKKVLIKRDELLPVLRRMQVFSDDNAIVELSTILADSTIRIFMMGVGHEDISMTSFSSEPIALKLSPHLFLEMVENFTINDLELRYFGDKSPMMMTDNQGEMSLLMPREKG